MRVREKKQVDRFDSSTSTSKHKVLTDILLLFLFLLITAVHVVYGIAPKPAIIVKLHLTVESVILILSKYTEFIKHRAQ